MILSRMTWPEVRDVSPETVMVVPTGSLEQHGPHLPLFTDTMLVTAVAEAVERRLGGQMLLLPTLWLGCSGHHLAFPGSLSASFEAYQAAIAGCVESLARHGFYKFYVLNGHGGNTEPNGVVLRSLRERSPNLMLGHRGYFSFIPPELLADVMEGPFKEIRHACEAEASLLMHLHPDLVRVDRLRDDGLAPDPPVQGMIHMFDEITEQGSLGYATLATAEKGRRLFDAAVEGVTAELAAVADGYSLIGLE